jgi:hypothetical protein
MGSFAMLGERASAARQAKAPDMHVNPAVLEKYTHSQVWLIIMLLLHTHCQAR